MSSFSHISVLNNKGFWLSIVEGNKCLNVNFICVGTIDNSKLALPYGSHSATFGYNH